MLSFFRRFGHRIISVFCALLIAALSVLYSVSSFAATSAWEDFGEGVIKLRDAYVDYVQKVGGGDFIGAAVTSGVDLPISWLKTLSDGSYVISPIDDLYYYISDGVLQFEDHREGWGSGRQRGEATEIQPEVPASFVKQVKDYWSDYYKPQENAQQFIFSYQSRGSSYPSPYALGSCCPVYMHTNGNWGGKNWDSFYFMLFYTDDSVDTYYSSEYFHVYTKREDGAVFLCVDSYSLSNGLFKETFSRKWEDIQIAPFLGVGINRGSIHNVFSFYCFASYADYLSLQSKSEVWYCQFDNMIDTKFNKSDFLLSDMLKSVSFTPDTNKNDDWGFLCSSEPFELFANQTQIDYSKIPDNYTITVNGDTIYDYSITNPDTGKSTKVTNYITNNYTIPDDGSSSGDSGSGSGSGIVNGNVTVGGKVDVSGKIEIDTKPIDININVNGGTGGSSGSGTGEVITPSSVEFDQDLSLNNYYDWMQEQTTGFSGFMKNFFAWLPEPIVIMLCAGFALVILARFLGR